MKIISQIGTITAWIPGSAAQQLIVMRRYTAPQRDVDARLASERLPWMSDDQRVGCRILPIALVRGLDEIDACIARTGVMADEIAQVMQENLARRTYTCRLWQWSLLPRIPF
ncbi:CorA family divalent cation transporter [Shigella flexneri]